MANPNPTRLDQHQVLQRSFDEVQERLRVDAVASIDSGSMEVIIDHADDSIKVGDGTDFLAVNTDGSINTNVQVSDISGETEKVLYGEIFSIAAAIESTVLTYTVPALKSFYMHRIETSGDNVAIYKVKINGADKFKKRTWWTKFNETFDFTCFPKKGIKVVAGDSITITVLHDSSMVGDFNASIQGVEVG